MLTTISSGLVAALVVGALSIWIAPWAEQQQYKTRDQAKAESEFGILEPGRFHEIRGGHGVFYVEAMSSDNQRMINVFIYLEEDGKRDVFSAASGFQKLDLRTGSRFVVLENGYRYEELPEGQGYRLHTYKTSGVRIAKQEIVRSQWPRIARMTVDLLNSDDPEDISELQWRISMPLACLLLTMLAVLLSRTSPRQGRFAKLFVALLVLIVYYYLLIMARSWVEAEKISPQLGMWWVHVAALVLIGALLMRQFGRRWFMQQLKLGAA
jgi:lipopolysaccharide export system permease protein